MRLLEAVVRTIAAAGKSLRLYPPASALPRQNVDLAVLAISQYFAQNDEPIMLVVTRDGLSFDGEPLVGTLGAGELVEQLRDHAVAGLSIIPGCSTDELLTFLELVERSAEEIRNFGGLGVALTSAGVNSVLSADIQLSARDTDGQSQAADVDTFLRDLIADPVRLGNWFAAAAAGDPKAFEEGLMDLVRISGPSGYEGLLSSLSTAFLAQNSEGRDALLRLAMDPGPSRDLTGGVLCHVSSSDIAGSVLGGDFGRNMLSLSSALTRLPLEQVTAQVRAEVQAMLPGSGHTSKEAAFLDHMIEVRESATSEPALIDADRTYRAVAEAAKISEDVIERARGAVAGSAGVLSTASVRTLLTLLDQQKDFALYCDTANSLAALVPSLIEQRQLVLASRALTELSSRESQPTTPWPDLPRHLREALAVAGGPRSMEALIRVVTEDRALLPAARDIVRFASDTGAPALVTAGVALKTEGLEVTELLLGRRIVDQLNRIAPQLQWLQLASVAERLAKESDPRSMQTLDAFMHRPDEQSRREVVAGVAAAGGPVAARILETALRDPSSEVAILAARSLGRSGDPNAASLLVKRLGELDMDSTGFELAREIIASLSRLPDPAVDTELARIAGRRTLIKRGHYGEIQDLVRQSQEYRAKGGAAR